MKKKISITLDSRILREADLLIDNIYIKNRSQAIEFILKNFLGRSKTAVILAGGPEEKLRIGEEFRPTVNVSGKTVAERAVQKLSSSGFKHIVIIARKNLLGRMFNILKDGSEFGARIEYIEEKVSRGTAQSLRLCKGRIQSSFLVVYCDIIFDNINLEEIWSSHLKGNALATIMVTSSQNPNEKGSLKMDGTSIVEFSQKRNIDSNLVFSPIFACEPEILNIEGESLEEDIFPKLSGRGLLNGHISSRREIHIHSERDAKDLKTG